MSCIDTSKVTVEYREGVCERYPVYNRKYTVTHSDKTAELFVTVGLNYAKDKYNDIRDEVTLQFVCYSNWIKAVGAVQIDVPGKDYDREKRKEIFIREMPKALQAIRYGDRKFFEAHKELDQAVIWIKFESNDFAYNKEHCFGKMRDFRC